ncbi:hypothetical protein [Amycolatopsis sp. NPDC054798]
MVRRTTSVDPANGPLAEFAAELRALRATLGRDAPTVDQISAAEKIPRSTLYAALKGTRLPSRETVAAFAHAWGGDEAEWVAKQVALEHQTAERATRRYSQSLRDGSTWLTVQPVRTVLVVVGSVASVVRALDVVELFGSDLRTQVVTTVEGGFAFFRQTSSVLAELGMVEIPWAEARRRSFDLVLAMHYSAEAAQVSGPLAVILPPSADKSLIATMAENPSVAQSSVTRLRQPAVGNQLRPHAFRRPDFVGAADDTGRQRITERLPGLADHVATVGDPYFDRMMASWPERSAYRQVLGVDANQRLIVACSTWGMRSLFARDPQLVNQLLAELPREKYRVALILHSTVWTGHGAWQVTSWLRDAIADGLLLVPPLQGERATLVAADCVLGDHGAMTYYAAALGHPVLTLGNHATDLAPAFDTTGALDPAGDLSEQLESAIVRAAQTGGDSTPRLDDPTTASYSGALREKLYQLLKLEPPVRDPQLRPVEKPRYANDSS